MDKVVTISTQLSGYLMVQIIYTQPKYKLLYRVVFSLSDLKFQSGGLFKWILDLSQKRRDMCRMGY